MSPAFSLKGPPPGHGGALRLDCVIVCRPPVWHKPDKQMIRGFRGESEVQIPIPAPQWLLTNKQYGKLAYDTSKIPSNWSNPWLDVTSTCHPNQLTWKDVVFREGAPGSPNDAGEQSDEALEGQVSEEEYEAPLILVRDGLYSPVVLQSRYPDDVELDVQALPPAIIPKLPTVSFDGIVEGFVRDSPQEGDLEIRPGGSAPGSSGCRRTCTPAKRKTGFARGQPRRWGWLANRKQSIFQPHSRFVCTLGKVVGILSKDVMLRPPEGPHDRVLIIVPEQWEPQPELLTTAESMAAATTGATTATNSPAHRARSKFRKSAGSSSQSSQAATSSRVSTQSSPGPPVTPGCSSDPISSSQRDPFSPIFDDDMALSSDTQPSADTQPSTNTQPSTSIQLSANTRASLAGTPCTRPTPPRRPSRRWGPPATSPRARDHRSTTCPEDSETGGGPSGQTPSQPRPKKSAPGARDKTRKRVSASCPQGRKRRTKSDVIEGFNESEKRRRPVPPRYPGPSTARPLPGTQPPWVILVANLRLQFSPCCAKHHSTSWSTVILHISVSG
ncbi:hypothetical protein CSOJ01_10894 [Colletotrichum sojae]|uniref:Uncharacterized protein n=1 Tax=Colletotrichum sojae TaxID=2175907 RepID=A0A8H6MNM8_9PEZI|nr:hypothetical protein CSOJ01_10894 [Colletotrichum sojae]